MTDNPTEVEVETEKGSGWKRGWRPGYRFRLWGKALQVADSSPNAKVKSAARSLWRFGDYRPHISVIAEIASLTETEVRATGLTRFWKD